MAYEAASDGRVQRSERGGESKVNIVSEEKKLIFRAKQFLNQLKKKKIKRNSINNFEIIISIRGGRCDILHRAPKKLAYTTNQAKLF